MPAPTGLSATTSWADVGKLLQQVGDLAGQVVVLKKNHGLPASSSAAPEACLSGTGDQPDQSFDPGALQYLTSTVLTVQADLQKMTAMAVDGVGPPEDWVQEGWQRWLDVEERSAGALSGETARAAMTAESAKGCLVELTATNASCLQKLRQLEHALHLLEGRSELGFGLWHELVRVFHRCEIDWNAAKARADLLGMAAASDNWRKSKRDWLIGMWRANCVTALFFSLYVNTWQLS